MSKQYNPEMPSAGYDQADFSALMASNITPTLATTKQMHLPCKNNMGGQPIYPRTANNCRRRRYWKLCKYRNVRFDGVCEFC